ncbi:hypothetical protein F511_42034 [Dorcoceras hygrometricum]|uniref:Uncharacterized protein n=1 Tax=Dorcoceras hygrometricum TaxID=472368 RepID=A0A2Z7D4K6_9LAMI|nr:hypothetical protein F511_42034 [Dorcoceras hygrometricum]
MLKLSLCENPEIQLSKIQPKKNSDLGQSTVNSDLGQSTINSDLGRSTVNSDLGQSTVNSDLRRSTVNPDLGRSNSQLIFGMVNSALTGQFSFGKVNSAHEFQQTATRVINQITSGKPIISSELSELNTVSVALYHTNFRRHTDVSVVIRVYGIFHTLNCPQQPKPHVRCPRAKIATERRESTAMKEGLEDKVSSLQRELQLQRCDNHSSYPRGRRYDPRATPNHLGPSRGDTSLLQTIQGLQEENGAPAPFNDEWEEEPKEDPEEEGLEDIPVGDGEIVDE